MLKVQHPTRSPEPKGTTMRKRTLAGAGLIAAGLLALTPAAAQATGGGHNPVLVCHNPVHNPVLIVVDDDSTKLKGHLGHQARLGDVIQGVGGKTADDVRAACVQETTVTLPPTTVTVPGPTVTVTGPTVTATATGTVTIPGPTVTGPATEVPGPTTTGPAVEVPGPTTTGPAVLIPGPTTTGPAVTVPGPTTTGAAVVIPGPTTTGEPQVVAAPKPGLIGGPKDTLAYTGANVSAAGLGILFLGAGLFLMGAGKRLRIVRPSA